MFESEVAADVLQVRRAGTRWLSTGPGGGYETADAAYNCTVPEGFDRTDLAEYLAERRERAGFDAEGPAMLTGVAVRHARRARLDGVEVVATAGMSNPARLPTTDEVVSETGPTMSEPTSDAPERDDGPPRPGTVNLVVGTTRALDDGALATLLGTAVEAKTATLLAVTGFSGTTSDAVVVGADPSGEPAAFAGSATPVGRAARICVRDAVRASLAGRYDGVAVDEGTDDGDDAPPASVAGADVPSSVADAAYGVVTEGRATVSRVDE